MPDSAAKELGMSQVTPTVNVAHLLVNKVDNGTFNKHKQDADKHLGVHVDTKWLIQPQLRAVARAERCEVRHPVDIVVFFLFS